jgi:hypothetical protein
MDPTAAEASFTEIAFGINVAFAFFTEGKKIHAYFVDGKMRECLAMLKVVEKSENLDVTNDLRDVKKIQERSKRRQHGLFLECVISGVACALVSHEHRKHVRGRGRDLFNPGQAGGVERCPHLRADSWEPTVGEWVEEKPFSSWRNLTEGCWLVQLAGDLGDELVLADAHGNADLERVVDRLAQLCSGINGAMLTICAEIEVSLVETPALNRRRIILGVAKDEAAELLVFLVVARNYDKAWAKLPCPCRWHGRPYTQLPGLVTGRGNDTSPLAAHGHGFSAQFAISRLFDAGEKRIRVQMYDHGTSCSSFAHDGAKNALNDQLLGRDKVGVTRVLCFQERSAVADNVALERRLAIEQSGHNGAIMGWL